MRTDKPLGHEFNRMYYAHQKYLKTHLKPYNIGVSEFHFLLHIPDHGTINQHELCQHTHVDKSLATRGINNLVGKGMITREKNLQNKKINVISLTDLGRSVKNSTLGFLIKWNEEVSSDLTPEELDLFTAQLRLLNERAAKINGGLYEY